MTYNYIHTALLEKIKTAYIQTFVVDRIISATEDFFLYANDYTDNYNPAENIDEARYCELKVNDNKYTFELSGALNGTKVHIRNDEKMLVFNYLIIHDPSRNNTDRDEHKYVRLEITKQLVPEEDYSFFVEYAKVLDKVVEEKIAVQNLFSVRTNEDISEPSMLVMNEIPHKLEMELSWVNSKKYVSERMEFSKFLSLDIDDINYNSTIYRFADRDPVIMVELFNHIKNNLMLGKLYRMKNVYMNGLFYVENCDLQDISELGCDRIDVLCSDETEPYKVIELYKEENDNES